MPKAVGIVIVRPAFGPDDFNVVKQAESCLIYESIVELIERVTGSRECCYDTIEIIAVSVNLPYGQTIFFRSQIEQGVGLNVPLAERLVSIKRGLAIKLPQKIWHLSSA